MQDAVDAAPALLEVLRHRLDVLGAVDVELEHVGLRVELGRRPLGHPAHAAERGEDHLGAGLLRLLGDLVRDRLAVDHSCDQELLAVEHAHVRAESGRSRRCAPARARRARRASTGPRRARGTPCGPSWLTTFHANVTSPASSEAGATSAIRPSTRSVSPKRTGRLNVASQTRRSATTRPGSNGTRPAASETTSIPWAIRSPNGGARRPLGVRVLRVPVAGQRGEAHHVGLGHGPPAGGELLAGLERLERRPPADRVGDGRRHSGMFLTPCAGWAIASSVDSASLSRRRVSPGRITSSM